MNIIRKLRRETRIDYNRSIILEISVYWDQDDAETKYMVEEYEVHDDAKIRIHTSDPLCYDSFMSDYEGKLENNERFHGDLPELKDFEFVNVDDKP